MIDHRLCMGWLANRGALPKDDRRGGLGESGGDLRRPIYEATNHERETKELEKVESGRGLNSLKKGLDKCPGKKSRLLCSPHAPRARILVSK